MCKIKFIDGEELEVSEVDGDNSEIDENVYKIANNKEEIIYELNMSQIKYIEW